MFARSFAGVGGPAAPARQRTALRAAVGAGGLRRVAARAAPSPRLVVGARLSTPRVCEITPLYADAVAEAEGVGARQGSLYAAPETEAELASVTTTPSQLAIVLAWTALELGLLLRGGCGMMGWAAAHPAAAALWGAALFAASWLVADLAVGIFHWAVDNYGEDDHPLVSAFQYHHAHPMAITRGELPTVVEGPCFVTIPIQLVALLAPPPLMLFAAGYCFWCAAAQVAHAVSHHRRSALPPAVRWMQNARIFITPQEHRGHHMTPIATKYCLLSGMWNGPLDNLRVFKALENAVYRVMGWIPRSWL